MFDTQDPRVRGLIDTISGRESIRRQHSDEDAVWILDEIQKLFSSIHTEHVTEIRHLKDQIEKERHGRLAAEKLAHEARDSAFQEMKDFVEQQRRLEPQASPAMMSSFLETMRGFFGTLGWLPGPQAMAETPASNPNDHESNSNSDNEDVAMNHSPREASSDAPSASASAQSPGVPPTSVRVPPTPKSPVPRKRKATTSSHDGDHPQAGRSPSKVIRTRSMTSIHSPSSSSTPSSNTRKGKRKARKCDDGLCRHASHQSYRPGSSYPFV